MKRVVLFRSSPLQDTHVLRALSLSSRVVDVWDRRDVRIDNVTLDRADVSVHGMPLTSFTHALLMGQPSPSPLLGAASGLDAEEQDFEANEWSVALLSALLHSGVQVLNRGLVNGAATRWIAKPGPIPLLAKAGWTTPALRVSRTKSGAESRQYGFEMGTLRKLFLCLTQKHELVFPEQGPGRTFSRRDLEAVRATRRVMARMDLDWLTLSLGISEGRVYAFGATTELPPELGEGGAAAVFSSCLSDEAAPATETRLRSAAE